MSNLDSFAKGKLAALEAQSLRRTLQVTARKPGARALRPGETEQADLVSFCCNDYLGLSHDPRIKQAAADAMDQFGVGSGASRLVTGNYPLLETLESRLAALKGTEAAVIFGSGYLTNLGVIPSFAGPGDLILVDELAHACLFGGAQLAGAQLEVFRHNDVAQLQDLLQRHRGDYRHALVLTDGVFSMDGDLAPIPDLSDVAKMFDAWLMTDDAHGIGVLGEGRGSSFVWGADQHRVDVPLQMGTLSKAVGSYGGYLCASRAVIDLIKTRARSIIYSTALPPASAAAALAALDVIEQDRAFCEKPLRHAQRFCRTLGLAEPQSPIVPLIIGDAVETLSASRLLEEYGFLVTAIRPPTVPDGTARLRFTFSADHAVEDIDRLADLVAQHLLPEAAQ